MNSIEISSSKFLDYIFLTAEVQENNLLMNMINISSTLHTASANSLFRIISNNGAIINITNITFVKTEAALGQFTYLIFCL